MQVNKILQIKLLALLCLGAASQAPALSWNCTPTAFSTTVYCEFSQISNKKQHNQLVQCVKNYIVDERKLNWKFELFKTYDHTYNDGHSRRSYSTFVSFNDNTIFMNVFWWTGKLNELCGENLNR